jgi:hypothetical protein
MMQRPLLWLSCIVLLASACASRAFAQEAEPEPLSLESIILQADPAAEWGQITEGGGFANEKMSKPITLVMRDRTLREILVRVGELAGIELVFNDERVAVRGVNIAAERKPVQHVLDELLLGRGISYVVSANGQVVIGNERRVAESVGTIRGFIQEKNGEPLVGAHIMIRGTRIGASTDAQGRYAITKLQPGLYTLEISCMGFGKIVRQVVVRAGEITAADFLMDVTSFMIGAIEVVGSNDALPREAQSKTTISGAEVEHFQASSIGDVLDLVPGVQKTDNPGLGKTSQIALRGGQEDLLSAFGTLVMLDGIPLSNNANMQFEQYSGAKAGTSTMGSGADLRMIPADNVASIEVVSGMPSVRFGDLTSGLINVQTKTGAQPNRLKVKNNPDTREANLGGGFDLGASGLSYNVNVAQSERDVRKDGDEYTRLTGQVVYSTVTLGDALSISAKVNGQKIFDEEESKGDVLRTKNYNRGHTLGVATWGSYAFTPGISTLDFNTYMTYRREDSHRSKLIQADLRILPNGDTISSYIGQVDSRGIEWTVGGRLEWNNTFFTGDVIHRTLMGMDVQYNANTGQGLLFDTLYNYYGSLSGKVPYAFDSIPGQTLLSMYAEDRISGHWGADFTLSLGFRYEMYRPYGLSLKGLWGDGELVKSHHGSFFNPRMSLLLAFSEMNQLRLSAGFSSKSPPMSASFPPPDALRWRNPATGALLYFRPNTWVPNLRGYREGQIEVSFDQKLFGSAGFTLTGYYRDRQSEPEAQVIPVFTTASQAGKTTAYLVDKYGIYTNDGWTISKGLEFTLRTGNIRPLNMEFRVVGSYSRTLFGRTNLYFGDTPVAAKGQYANNPVPGADTLIGWWYPSLNKWRDRLLVNYYLRYTVAPLGLWVTVRAEQTVWERYQEMNLVPVDMALLSPTDRTQRLFDEDIKPRYLKWLVNVNISKSLFKGAEVSFYVNNVLDDPAITQYMRTAFVSAEDTRNPDLFYGLEFSMVIDELFRKGD